MDFISLKNKRGAILNITITNVNQDIVRAIEVLLRPFVKKHNVQIIKEDDKVIKAIEKFEKELQQEDGKVYKSLAEYKKAMNV